MRATVVVFATALLLTGCGSGSTGSTPSTSGPATGSTLTGPEQRFLSAVTAAVPGAPGRWSNADLTQGGYAACTSLNNNADNPEAAVAAVGTDFDDASARAVVRAAADDLCPAASVAGLSPTAPPSGASTVAQTDGAGAQSAPTKFVYHVLGNYRATQLHYTASNGDMVTLNDTGNIHTAGSALPWNGEATPEPNGNPNVLSVSTLSAKGDSYITCTIADQQGNVVASNTGRGAYASCYASTPA